MLGYVGEIGADQLKALKAQGLPGRRPHRPRRRRGRVRVGAARHAPRSSRSRSTRPASRSGRGRRRAGRLGRQRRVPHDRRRRPARGGDWRCSTGSTARARCRTRRRRTRATRRSRRRAARSWCSTCGHGAVRRDGEQSRVPARRVGRRHQPVRTSTCSTTRASHFPLVNRATQGQYAPGSTFKLVTVARGDPLRHPHRRTTYVQRHRVGGASVPTTWTSTTTTATRQRHCRPRSGR